MSVTQTDERIEVDIEEIVESLFPEDVTATSSPSTRSDSTAQSGVPVEPSSESSGWGLSGIVSLLFWVFVVVAAAGATYLIFKMFIAKSPQTAERPTSKRPGLHKRKTASKSKSEVVQESEAPETREPVEQRRPRLPEDVESWLAKALVANNNGDFREAVRCHYRALIALLAHRKFVVEDETTTVGEYLLEVYSSTPGNTRTFASAAGLFEVAWYSDKPLAAGQSSEMEHLFDELQVATR